MRFVRIIIGMILGLVTFIIGVITLLFAIQDIGRVMDLPWINIEVPYIAVFTFITLLFVGITYAIWPHKTKEEKAALKKQEQEEKAKLHKEFIETDNFGDDDSDDKDEDKDKKEDDGKKKPMSVSEALKSKFSKGKEPTLKMDGGAGASPSKPSRATAVGLPPRKPTPDPAAAKPKTTDIGAPPTPSKPSSIPKVTPSAKKPSSPGMGTRSGPMPVRRPLTNRSQPVTEPSQRVRQARPPIGSAGPLGSAPIPTAAAPVQAAPPPAAAPVQQVAPTNAAAPVQHAAPVQQVVAPAPAPAPVQQAPAPPAPKARGAQFQIGKIDDPHEAMARLVVIGQHKLNRENLQELLSEFYPEIVTLADHIPDDCDSTMETIGMQVISIARARIKLMDKQLANDQFSIFQEKFFQLEQENFIRMYKPDDISNLTDEQGRNYGAVVDKRDWERVQRIVLGNRADWIDISISNANQYVNK